MIDAGSGAVTFGEPNSPGVTPSTANDTIVSPYNDFESLKKIFEKNTGEIAAVIIEPIAGNMGCIVPKNDFLFKLRKICSENETLLIFDEVMTGFRLAKGGAQERLGVNADIITYGKVIGGGLPVGAFASRNEIMNELSPDGKIYQAGTLSGNPLAMIAGLTTLNILNENPEIYKSLDSKTEYLKKGMISILKKTKIPFTINSFGSMISLHFCKNPVVDFKSAMKGDNQHFKNYFHGMLKEGIYLPPSPFESYFLNDSLSFDDIEYTLSSLEKIIEKI